jgi:hypothetical protein
MGDKIIMGLKEILGWQAQDTYTLYNKKQALEMF